MSTVIEALERRWSIKAFKHTPIPQDKITRIIEAGNRAPQEKNPQPWRFIVVEDTKLKKKILHAARPNSSTSPRKEDHKDTEDLRYYSAPTIIFVIGKSSRDALNCMLVCQTIMIAASSYGIGSCYMGHGTIDIKDNEVSEALDLKAGEKIFGPIALGYPDEDPKPPKEKWIVLKWIPYAYTIRCPKCGGMAESTRKEFKFGVFDGVSYKCKECEKPFNAFYRDNEFSHTVPKQKEYCFTNIS